MLSKHGIDGLDGGHVDRHPRILRQSQRPFEPPIAAATHAIEIVAVRAVEAPPDHRVPAGIVIEDFGEIRLDPGRERANRRIAAVEALNERPRDFEGRRGCELAQHLARLERVERGLDPVKMDRAARKAASVAAIEDCAEQGAWSRRLGLLQPIGRLALPEQPGRERQVAARMRDHVPENGVGRVPVRAARIEQPRVDRLLLQPGPEIDRGFTSIRVWLAAREVGVRDAVHALARCLTRPSPRSGPGDSGCAAGRGCWRRCGRGDCRPTGPSGRRTRRRASGRPLPGAP